MIKNILDYGDQAVLIDFGNEIKKEINQNVIFVFKKLKQIIKEENIQGIENIIPSYNKLVIQFNLNLINSSQVRDTILTVKDEKFEINFKPKKLKFLFVMIWNMELI